MQLLARYLGNTGQTYDGLQLAPHWIYKQVRLQGNAIVAWRGACEVKITEMVDIEDVLANAPISSREMVHFIAEFFDNDLEKAVYRQRLLIVTAKEWLEQKLGMPVARRGDDLYLPHPNTGREGKLSVSIATASPVSTLIHTGFNVISAGTPVPTVGLADFKLDPDEFAGAVLSAYSAEVLDIWQARCKVRPV